MKETKEIILETAYNMFLSNNYEAVTISNIIKATGMTKGAIYHYYESKEELFKAVIDRFMVKEDLAFPSESASFEKLILEYIETKKQHYLYHRQIFQDGGFQGLSPVNLIMQHLSLVVSAYRYYPGYMERGGTFFRANLEQWEKAIEKAVKKGELRPDIDVNLTAINFIFVEASVAFCNLLKGDDLDNTIVLYERQMKEIYKNIKA
ncbi:MAG: TetR/AcrR family transcriptional regulator [Paludibacteraceae bacterium]|nr:TetR/AcrR family transcriptional regulator [Paludibacteraceae bacterium]